MDLSVTTRATPVTDLSSFNVIAVTGAAGSQSDYWGEVVEATQSGSSYLTGKYWASSDPNITGFYASNADMSFDAAGPSITVSNANTDVVCAYNSSPTYGTSNVLEFEHVFARLGTITFNTQEGYELQAGVTAQIYDYCNSGTYNLRTKEWSNKGAYGYTPYHYALSVNNSTQDLWILPGTYVVAFWYTLIKGDYHKFMYKFANVTLEAGKVNNLTVTAVGGDAEEIMLDVSVTPWESKNITVDFGLVFEAISDGTIIWKTTNASAAKTLQYSTDGGSSWNDWTSTTDGASINVVAGDKIYLRGDNTAYYTNGNYSYFAPGTATYYVYGSMNELLSGTYSVADYAFYHFFYNNTAIRSHPTKKLSLPASTLGDNCYCSMFYGCTGLSIAPILPAISLKSFCYYEMFRNCTSLTSAPELPARTLADWCYYGMFYGCSSLSSAPELPATTLASYCYMNMFFGCANITYIKAMFTTTPTDSYTQNWVYGVAASGTFVKNSAASWDVTGANGVPSGWTVQNAE